MSGPWYVRSGAGGTADGTSWANAALTLAAGLTFAGNLGDTVYVAEDHAETQGSAMTLQASTNPALPTKVWCVNHAGTVPPVTADLATTATVTTTGTFGITILGYASYYGISFSASTGLSAANFSVNNTLSNGTQFEQCVLGIANTAATSVLLLGDASTTGRGNFIELLNTQLSFGAVGQVITVSSARVHWTENRSSPPSGIIGTTPTTLFSGANNGGYMLIDGIDLSALASGTNLVNMAVAGGVNFTFANCKLGASVSAATGTPVGPGGVTVRLHNCDDGTKNYRQEYYAYQGSMVQETTVVRNGGASDGVTQISWKVVTNANVTRHFPFELPIIAIWNNTIGAHTSTIEINSGGSLNTNDIWAEYEYLGSSATPISTTDIASRQTNFLPSTATAAQTSSTATWAGGLAGSTTQKLVSASDTINMLGYIKAVVKVGKATATIYVDPLITVA